MTLNLKRLVFLLLLIVVSCKKENTFSNYQYADNGIVINCDNENTKLYSEALFSFENDITNYYKKNTENLQLAYAQLIRSSIVGRTKFEEIVSPHTLEIFEVLKKESDLWNVNNSVSNLNYDSSLMECLANNIQNQNLKTTFNALLTTNSMSPKLVGTPLMTNYRSALSDKYLATYIAFDMFYAKLFDIDFSKVNLNKPKVDFNKIPPSSNPNPTNN